MMSESVFSSLVVMGLVLCQLELQKMHLFKEKYLIIHILQNGTKRIISKNYHGSISGHECVLLLFITRFLLEWTWPDNRYHFKRSIISFFLNGNVMVNYQLRNNKAACISFWIQAVYTCMFNLWSTGALQTK